MIQFELVFIHSLLFSQELFLFTSQLKQQSEKVKAFSTFRGVVSILSKLYLASEERG